MATQQYATTGNPAYKRKRYLEMINAQAPSLFGQKQAAWNKQMAEREAEMREKQLAMERARMMQEQKWNKRQFDLAETQGKAQMGLQAADWGTKALTSDIGKMSYGEAWDKGKKKLMDAVGYGGGGTPLPQTTNVPGTGGMTQPQLKQPGFWSNVTLGNTLGAGLLGFGAGNLAPAMGIKNKWMKGGVGALAGGLGSLFTGGGPIGAGLGALFGGLGGMF